MRIGVYGGTFDPPHIGHMNVVETAAQQLRLDLVLVIPAGNSHMKDAKKVANINDRWAMCKAFRKCKTNVSLTNYETLSNTPSYTADTIAEIKRDYGEDNQLFLILDAEDFRSRFIDWHNPEYIVENCTFAVIGKDETGLVDYVAGKCVIQKEVGKEVNSIYIGQTYPRIFNLREDKYYEKELCSTIIRNRIKEGRKWEYLVHEDVAKYIKEKKLYGYK